MYLLQLSKMKRIDFLYGVVSITIFLFLPIFFQVYGFLDVQKYRSVTSDNSYYENSSEPILAYTYYRTLLFYIFTFLIVLLVGLIYVSSKEKDLTRFQIQCYRPLSLYGVSYSIRSKIRQYERLYT